MARRRKNDATTQNDTSMQDWNRSLGYSDKSLKALESGAYGQLTNRKSTSMKSEDQTRIANPTPLPVLEGINTNNSDWESSFGRAKQYQKNLENEAKKYQYNESAAQRNSLDEKDQGYLQRLVDRFGDGDLVRSSLSESKKNEWEQKYGKSIDRIYADFMADQDNAKMRQGQEHSVLSTISSTLGSALSPLTALPSLAANIIDPDSETAKTLEKTRADYSKQRKLLRAGVKENLGDTGDKIYDTATQIGDRMVNAAAGKVLGGKLGGALMTGLSDADQQMDELNLRPGMSGRKKAASALAHGAVEGAGTAIELNALGNLPEVGGIGGRLLNVGRGALSGAGENIGAEILENMLDTRIGGENSKYQLNKALYMLNGMSEEDATKQADSDQTKQVAMAGLMGGIFGGGMKGISEFADSLKKDKIPSLWTPDNKPVDTSDIDDTIAKPKSLGDPYRVPEGWTVEDLENATKDIPETPAKADSTGLPQRRMPASEDYSIQTVYAEDGSPRYFVRENVSDTGSRPVEPGKVYKTAEEAQKALDNLNKKVEPTKAPDTDIAARYAQAMADYDNGKGYFDDADLKEMSEELADDIARGNDLTKHIETLEENIEDAENPEVAARMQTLVDELDAIQNGEVKPVNEVPNVKTTEAATAEDVPNILPTASNGGSVPPEPPKGPETDISRRYETLKNSDLFQKSEANMKMLETAKEKGVFNKDIESRAKAQADALKEFTEDPTKAINDNLDKQWTSGKDLDTSMLVLNDALDSGSQAYANLVMLKQAQQTKNAGRVLRAALDYAKRNYAGTKESTLQEAAKFLNDKADALLKNRKTAEQFDAIAQRIMNGDLSDLNTRFNMDDVNIQNIKDALEAGAGKTDIAHMIAMYQSVGKTGISADALQKVTDIYNQIQAQNLKPNSRARANLETDAFKVLADDIGGKRNWKDMWDSWRYLAMLGNPKTHLRNLLGNATHYMVTEAKDNIGAVIEGAVDKANRFAGGEGIERTKSVLTAKDRGLVKAGEVDADDVAYAALNDSGNKYNVKNEIERAMSSFNNKALSKVDELNSNLLDLEDYSALKRKYSKSLARFLKANGADESIFKATDDASKELLDKGRAYAIDQAKQATFHEYSQLANALNTLSKNLRESDNLGTKAAGVAVEGLVPFKKTPINILKQAGKYSPISLATGVKKAVDAVKTGNSTAAEAIEDLSAGMTGSMIMGLGAFLAHEGYLTGGANADYTVDNAETEQGAQNYALKIGDNSYTLDWLAPMALPLFVGAELMRESENGGEGDALDRVISSISTIAEPITEMSMLQGIQNILNELSYSKENAIATFGTNATLGYATQGIPTLFGQIARAADDTRRSTYTDQPAGYKRQVDKTITKTLNKLPFVSMASQPYVDSSGNEQQNEGLATALLGNNFGTRLADQMLSPGYFKQGTITETDKELNRLYEATGENVYKDIASGKIGNNPDKISKENFTKYQKLYGSNNDYLYDEIIKTDAYKNLDDAEKVKTLDALKSASKMIADHEIGGKELKKSEQTVYDIYKSQGKKGLLKYFEDKATAESLGMKYDEYIKKESETPGGAEQWAADKQAAEELGFVNKDGRVDTSSYQKAIGQAGDMSQKFISDLPVLQELGLERSAYYTYANAINEIPSLTPSEFAQTYEEINTNPNNAITQKELLDYINSFEYDDPSEAEDLWYAYGGWTKKDGTPKKLKWDGKKFVAYY